MRSQIECSLVVSLSVLVFQLAPSVSVTGGEWLSFFTITAHRHTSSLGSHKLLRLITSGSFHARVSRAFFGRRVANLRLRCLLCVYLRNFAPSDLHGSTSHHPPPPPHPQTSSPYKLRPSSSHQLYSCVSSSLPTRILKIPSNICHGRLASARSLFQSA